MPMELTGKYGLMGTVDVFSDTGHRLLGLHWLGGQFRVGSRRPSRSDGFA
jgi:hypothetical protein